MSDIKQPPEWNDTQRDVLLNIVAEIRALKGWPHAEADAIESALAHIEDVSWRLQEMRRERDHWQENAQRQYDENVAQIALMAQRDTRITALNDALDDLNARINALEDRDED